MTDWQERGMGLRRRNVWLYAAVAVLSQLTTPAKATSLTYSQWHAMPVAERAAYIAGVLDTMNMFNTPPDERYADCIGEVDEKMTGARLALDLSNFVDGRPDLEERPVQAGLSAYLLKVCGR